MIYRWGHYSCQEISSDMIQDFILGRNKDTSAFTANKELRYLRSLFNFGIKPLRGFIHA